jgi:hypothetical protein
MSEGDAAIRAVLARAVEGFAARAPARVAGFAAGTSPDHVPPAP